jgi:hypothetical protein
MAMESSREQGHVVHVLSLVIIIFHVRASSLLQTFPALIT